MIETSSDAELSISQAAELARVRRRTLRGLIKVGELRAHGPAWRRRILLDDLVALVCARIREQWLGVHAEFDAEPAEDRSLEFDALDEWKIVALPDGEALAKVAAQFDARAASAYGLFPLDLASHPRKLLAAWPTRDPALADGLERLLGGPVKFVVAHRNPWRNKKIVERLINEHCLASGRGGASEVRPEAYRPDRGLVDTFLECTGAILERDESFPLARLLGLIAAEAVKSGADGVEMIPTEEGVDVYYVWGAARSEIDSPPARLAWGLAFTAMAAFGMDIRNTGQPQQGGAEAQFKNGTVHFGAACEPTELGPKFVLSLERHISGQ